MVILNWVLIFLLISIISGYLGFGGVSLESNKIARVLFVIFLTLLVIALLQQQDIIMILP